MTTPPTQPRPEPVATADLVARARAEAQTVGSAFCDTLTERLLTALAKALEDAAAERGDAVVRIAELEAGLEAERQRHRETYASHVDLSERLLDARERIAKLEAGLRRMTNPHGPADGTWYRQAARDLLADATSREIVSTDAKREVRP